METEQLEIKTKSPEQRAKEKKAKIFRKRSLWLSISVLIILADQISKWYITEIFLRPRLTSFYGTDFFNWYLNMPTPLDWGGVYMTPYFNLVMAWNTGVSFSMFSGQGAYMWAILIAVALVITSVFLYWLWHAKRHIHGVCYAFVIGGAIGNILDRARFGAVIDFLDFHIYGYHWPAFNVADMAVVTGVSLLIIVSLFFDIQTKERYRKRKKKKRQFKKILQKRFGATRSYIRK